MLGLHLGSLAIGAAVGVVGTVVYVAAIGPAWSKHAGMQTGAPGKPADVLHGKIVAGPPGQALSGPGRIGHAPKLGVATIVPYEWGYVVGNGDTAGSIAAAITGDDSRYVELMLANPHLMAVGEPGVYFGPDEWNFAPGALTPGLALLLPVPWSRYIDQTGRPRGGPVPFPPDGSGSALGDLLESPAMSAAPAPAALPAGTGPTGYAPAPADTVASSPSSSSPVSTATAGRPRVVQTTNPYANAQHPLQTQNPAPPYGQAFTPKAA